MRLGNSLRIEKWDLRVGGLLTNSDLPRTIGFKHNYLKVAAFYING